MSGIASILSAVIPTATDTFLLERTLHTRGFPCVAGVDEAGRGPLAGPVVAACVVLPARCDTSVYLDSKKLSPRRRSVLAQSLSERAAQIGIGTVSAATIDRINILQASLLAMKRAVENMPSSLLPPSSPVVLLIDGLFPIPMPVNQYPLVKGESKSASIAAASIIAKVTRDRIMEDLAQQFPVYNFSRNKGYPTREHRAAIASHGPSPCHRRSFKGVKEFV